MIVILLGGAACGKNVIAKCLVRGAIAQNPYEKVPTESCSRLIGITTRPKRLRSLLLMECLKYLK